MVRVSDMGDMVGTSAGEVCMADTWDHGAHLLQADS